MTPATIRISGHVTEPLDLTVSDIAAMESVVEDAAVVAQGAIGCAVPVADLLTAAAPLGSATHCTVIGAGGAYRASIPLATLAQGGWLAFAIGAEPLPEERGGPFRLTVAAGETLCWNVKHVNHLRVTEGPEPDDVPADPPH